MKGRLLQRLRQLSISNSLRGAFLTGALLTLIVSMVSLYSWHEQSSQVRYSLDEYFPRIHSAFLIEGNLNLAVDQLNEFLLAPNTTVRLQLRTQIIQHLDKIEHLSQGLQLAERRQLAVILQDSRTLLAELDNALYNMFLVREKVSELSARIDWLHDDFTTELNSLVQDFTWQQGTLLDQIEANQGDAAQYLQRSREVQNEQQQVYTLARIENQIVDDLRDRLNELKSGNNDGMLVETHIRYLENLKKTADENIRALDDWPSTITLRQTIDELLEIGMVKNKMPDTMRDYVAAQKALLDASRAREATLGRFRTLLEAQLGSSHQQMQTFNQRLEQIVRVSGGLILVATLLALLLAWGLNHYFIRSRLVKRFTALNQAVVQIGLGRTDSTIPVYGRDELGRIARLLRHTLGQLNMQRRQLEQEVAERKEIEADLRAMQDELIQTAKLAVVGQTMTTLAHEINQPLNALSMYLFTAKLAVVGQTMTTLAHEINQPLNALSMYLFTAGRAIEQGQSGQARNTLTKAEGLINRIDAIIRSLRQFTRRAELETPLYPVDLRQTFVAAWELLAMRHQSRQGALSLPTDTVWVSGDEVRIQQVLVNVLANALDACSHDAAIAVTWQTQGEALEVYIADNGPGWPVALLPSLLKPFTTSKAVGLGIGLSISVSLMAQMKGDLRLASTLTRNACVVLQFSVTDVDDVE
ncbi:two-component system sensor histidine kinase PgtB [Salmonella enterica]|nr:two-component system sensor histidine kinase PgtB [Salmonella enterica]ELX3596702.1 two-component system sensor histidine kinase PgtB [Salmonella enterica subsp. enterica serovar Infantis]EJE3202072.1 two-component system sensor histidine kinase PgtB [Salmonella enterica]EJE3256228.1 two-component system sensor histidine kinase PgtB [Salmonella enterica]EJE3267823.1 two-component system sensor histidine kinase PgtB [Salmonella enterica]